MCSSISPTSLLAYDPAHWLAVLYKDGRQGLKKDLVAAYAWHTISETNDHSNIAHPWSPSEPKRHLRELAEKMTPEQMQEIRKSVESMSDEEKMNIMKMFSQRFDPSK